jgi:hypothetical protein
VFLCPHVFRKEKSILEVIRDPDGHWQFFCGGIHDFENEGPHVVGIGHLIEEDPSIQDLAIMEKGTYAERNAVGEKWKFGVLEE